MSELNPFLDASATIGRRPRRTGTPARTFQGWAGIQGGRSAARIGAVDRPSAGSYTPSKSAVAGCTMPRWSPC